MSDRAEEAVKPVLLAWTALRTRAREAEERAETERSRANIEKMRGDRATRVEIEAQKRAVNAERERDEAREQLAKEVAEQERAIKRTMDACNALRADLAAANARAEEAEGELRAAKNELLAAVEHHANARKVIDAILPNEWPDGVSCWQAAVDAFNAQRAARLRAEAERDEALTEANDLRLRVERLVAGAAKLTERAEEAEEELRLADFRVRSAEAKADGLLAKLAAAEAEVKRLTALSPSHTVALRLDEINAAFDGPIPTAWPKDVTGSVVSRIAALRERAERLVRAGDDLARWVDPASQAAQNWAAAKADSPAAKETKS